MAAITDLSVMGVPGPTFSFSPKQAALATVLRRVAEVTLPLAGCCEVGLPTSHGIELRLPTERAGEVTLRGLD